MANAGDRFDRFVLEKQIEVSGMAEIWLAYHEQERQQKAVVKIALLSDKADGSFDDLIRCEAEALMECHHPNIPQIYPLTGPRGSVEYFARAAQQPGQPWFFVMEYIPGMTLAKSMGHVHRMPFEWRMELFYRLMGIIDYLYMKGYAHCDLKPENIMLRGELEKFQAPDVVLLDFGTVSNVDQYDPHHSGGTTAYAPPELVAVLWKLMSRDQLFILPHAVDVWSLGALFYELVTGQKLVRHKDEKTAVTSIMRGELPNFTSASVRLDNREQFDLFLGAMLHHQPEKRQSITTLIRALDRLVPPPRIRRR
jgi:eukaryotic-like serine/threonine-protein kinase